MMSWIRKFRLWNKPAGPLCRDNSFFTVTLLSRVVYLLAIRNSMQFLNQSDAFIVVSKLTLLWPLAWAASLERETLIFMIAVLSLSASFIAFLFPGPRISRIFAFAGYLFLVTVDFIYANVGHAAHATLWTMALLSSAPSWKEGEKNRGIRERVLLNFFHCQVLLAFFYFNAGLWKVWSAFHQLINGEHSAFQFDALSRIMAERLLIGNTSTIFGPWLINQPLLGFFSLWFTIYVEISILLAVFRPQLHRIFGATLILFHLITAVTLAPNFSLNVIVLGLFFVLSPFHPKNWSLALALRSLPGYGCFSFLKKRIPNK